MTNLQKVENTILYLILGVTPLLFCNQMTYNFHTPKYLFFQLTIFSAVMIILLKSKIRVCINLLDSLILLRLLWMLPLVFFTARYANLFENVDIFAYLVIFYFVIQLALIDRNRSEIIGFLNRTVVVLSIVYCLEAIYGVMQYFGHDFFHPGGYHSYESDVVGAFGSANSMGCYLATLMPFLLYFVRTQKTKIIKTFAGLSICLALAALILTLSRGAWLALLGGLLFLFYPAIAKILKKNIPSRLARAGIFALVVLLVILLTIGVFFLNIESALGRIFIWRVSGLMVADHPIIGVGYGNYGYQYLNYQQKFFDNPANAIYYDKACNIKLAHSEFVHVTAETGVIGLFLFCSIFVLFLTYARRILSCQIGKEENFLIRVTTASFIIIALHSLVDSVLHTLPISILFYFVIAVISVLSKKYSDSNEKWDGKIAFGKKTHAFIILIGFILLAFNIYRVVWKGTGFIHWKNGQVAVLAGDWDSGVANYEKAIRYIPDNGELQFHLGAAYAYTGQLDKALTLIQQSQKSFNDKNIYLVLGQIYLRLGDYTKAEDNLKTVTYMYPQLLSPHLLLAKLYQLAGYQSKAISELEFIISAEPKIISDEVRAIKRDAMRMLNGINH